MMMIK